MNTKYCTGIVDTSVLNRMVTLTLRPSCSCRGGFSTYIPLLLTGNSSSTRVTPLYCPDAFKLIYHSISTLAIQYSYISRKITGFKETNDNHIGGSTN